MTRAKDISKIVTDANLSGTLDVTGAFTSQGIDDNANATAITIDSSENVGIGTSSPTFSAGGGVHNKGTSGAFTSYRVSVDSNTGVDFSQGSDGKGYIYNRDNADLIIATNNTERMRINSAGSVSIGTSSSPNNAPLLIKCATDDNIRISQQTHASIQAVNDAASAFTELKLDGSTLLLNSQSGGNVGIGASSPSTTLHLDSGGSTTTIQIDSDTEASIDFNDHGGSPKRYKIGTNISSNDGQLEFKDMTANAERMRIDSSGNLIKVGGVIVGERGTASAPAYSFSDDTDTGMFNDANAHLGFSVGGTERMRIDSSGNLLVGTTNTTPAQSNIAGALAYRPAGQLEVNGNNTGAASFGRTDDGRVIDIYSAGTREGSIDVSGTTVSLAGAHLNRWSRLVGGGQPNTILRGTVMSNLDEMVEWVDEDNEQLNHTKVSDVEGDIDVAGVFQSWDIEDDFDDYYLAMTGDFVIRIAQGTTVARGDLLMSAGDGTAKPQGDDIVRSKTIAKVTSTNVSHTYDDGTYLLPCVLMAC